MLKVAKFQILLHTKTVQSCGAYNVIQTKQKLSKKNVRNDKKGGDFENYDKA